MTSFFLSLRRTDSFFLCLCFCLLILAWLPSLSYPLFADTAIYGVLGDTLLHHHSYSLFGVPHSKYLPMYPFLTIPFTSLFGFQFGLKLASLLSGILVLFLAFTVVQQVSSVRVARLTVVFLLVQHAFPIMVSFGASDLPFTALVLASLLAFLRSKRDPRFFIIAGAFLGFAILTRYNAFPLLPLFCVSFLNNTRRFTLSGHSFRLFLMGVFLAILPLSLWFLRNYFVFGTPFPADYVLEQGARGGVTIHQLLRNLLFYGNPLHTIGVLFPFALLGLVRYYRRYLFLVLSMFALWVLATFWWSLGVRHVFPGFPILLFFAALQCSDFYDYLKQKRWMFFSVFSLFIPMIMIQSASVCLYSFPACNAAVDEWNLSFIPKDLHLTQEGMYAWNKAAEWMNVNLPKGEWVFFQDSSEAFVMKHGYFRDDIFVYSLQDFFLSCQDYPHSFGFIITQRQQVDDSVVYTVPELVPATDVRKVMCR